MIQSPTSPQVLCIIKPWPIEHELVTSLLLKLCNSNLQPTRIHFYPSTTKEHWLQHYVGHTGKDYLEPMCNKLAGRPALVVLLRSNMTETEMDFYKRVKQMQGPAVLTKPKSPYHLRFDTSNPLDSADNGIHLSDSAAETIRETKVWFPNYKPEDVYIKPISPEELFPKYTTTVSTTDTVRLPNYFPVYQWGHREKLDLFSSGPLWNVLYGWKLFHNDPLLECLYYKTLYMEHYFHPIPPTKTTSKKRTKTTLGIVQDFYSNQHCTLIIQPRINGIEVDEKHIADTTTGGDTSGVVTTVGISDTIELATEKSEDIKAIFKTLYLQLGFNNKMTWLEMPKIITQVALFANKVFDITGFETTFSSTSTISVRELVTTMRPPVFTKPPIGSDHGETFWCNILFSALSNFVTLVATLNPDVIKLWTTSKDPLNAYKKLITVFLALIFGMDKVNKPSTKSLTGVVNADGSLDYSHTAKLLTEILENQQDKKQPDVLVAEFLHHLYDTVPKLLGSPYFWYKMYWGEVIRIKGTLSVIVSNTDSEVKWLQKYSKYSTVLTVPTTPSAKDANFYANKLFAQFLSLIHETK